MKNYNDLPHVMGFLGKLSLQAQACAKYAWRSFLDEDTTIGFFWDGATTQVYIIFFEDGVTCEPQRFTHRYVHIPNPYMRIVDIPVYIVEEIECIAAEKEAQP